MDIGTYSPGPTYSIIYKLIGVFSPQLEILKEISTYHCGQQYEDITRWIPFIYQDAVMRGNRIHIQSNPGGRLEITIEERKPVEGAVARTRRRRALTPRVAKAPKRTPITAAEKILAIRTFSPSFR